MASKTSAPAWLAPFDFVASAAQVFLPLSLLLLVQRLGIAAVFFMSGRTKVDGWLTARSIVDAGTLPAESVERALLGLLCAGLVEYLPEAPRKAAPPVPTYTH